MVTTTTGIATEFIQFTRASNATVTDSDGLVKWAPANLLLASESFNAAAWTKAFAVVTAPVVTANNVAAPNGTQTADRIAFPAVSGTNANSLVFQSPTQALSTPHTAAVYLRGDAGGEVVWISWTTDGVTYSRTQCTLTTSWQLFTLAYTTAASGVQYIQIGVDLRDASQSAKGAQTIYAWGASVYRSDLGGMQPNTSAYPFYNPTTPKNLLGFTESLTTGWTNSNTTDAIASEVNPVGLTGAVDVAATSANGTLLGSLSLLASPYTFSIWLKRKTGSGTVEITVDGTTYVAAAVTGTWTRFSTTLTPAAGTKTPGIRLVTSGDAVYAWGAQLSDSASLDSYSPVYGAAVTSAAYYGPRRDFDPVTLACKGLLVEEQRTNLLLNSATLSTQNVTVTAAAHTLTFYGTGTITLSGTSTAGPLVGTGVNNRVSLTFTPTAGTLTLTVTGSVTQAQLELGAFATSYIPVGATSAEATRNADVASVSTQAFPYSATEGTLVANFTPTNVAAARRALQLDDATEDERITLGTNSTPNGLMTVIDGGSSQASIATGTPAANTTMKLAARFKVNDFAVSANGAAVGTGTSGTIPTMNTLRLGSGTSSTEPLNGWLRQVTYLPRALTDAELVTRST